MKALTWTPEEEQYLRKHYADEPTVDIASKMGRSSVSIKTRASKLKLRKSKEMKAANCIKHVFSVRSISPEGTIVERELSGRPYLLIKIECGWIPLHHYNWIEKNGPIPKGMILTFKDGNRRNCSPDNLELTTQAEIMKKYNIHELYPEELKSAIFTLGVLKRTIIEHEQRN